ncbi:uncharacterized protein LOC117148376 isoform X1 [Drosophila mauritiana]|uniref:Uncharacterized protein LOC117148376 isoform X1 n=2 Tax=Drosophila mauritiana TaxID=7226 RepID=A0A6P8KRJ5_DROMA|nr:uncharacterized protein LOC117148376 isoform X1 [Drosophila mauritiana]
MNFFEQISDQFCGVMHTNLKIPISYCETRCNWKFSANIDTIILFYTLSFGILRVVFNLIDFVNLSLGGTQLGRPSCLLILRGAHSGRLRALKQFLMLQAWMLVIYGMVSIKPLYINPFVVISVIILTSDMFVLLLDIRRHARIPLVRRVTLWEMILKKQIHC